MSESLHHRSASDCSTVVSLDRGVTTVSLPGTNGGDPLDITINRVDVLHELVQLSDHGYAVRGQRDECGKLIYQFEFTPQERAQVGPSSKVKRRGAFLLLAIFKSGLLTGKLLAGFHEGGNSLSGKCELSN